MSKIYQEYDNKQYSIKTTKEQFSELMNFAESENMVCIGKGKDGYVFCPKDYVYEAMEHQSKDYETITGEVKLVDGEVRMYLSEFEKSKLNGHPEEFETFVDIELPDELIYQMMAENIKTQSIIFKNKLPCKKPIPEYIEKELDQIPLGYIKSDRRTLETTVENFIEYFIVGGIIFNTGILLNFKKQDGSEISPKGAQQAISRVKEKLREKS
jgi:hypothetical protein